MMFPMPFYRMPYYRRYPPYYVKTSLPATLTEKESSPKRESKNSTSLKEAKIETEKRNNSDDNSQFLNILGIKLYFDDILIICLLFFLYQEGVKDEMLFIALILLLLS